MSKKKSAICLTLITLVIAVLCIVCFVSFPCGEIYYYNSLLSLTDKSADLGEYLIGETDYVGGAYSVVYYPDGVVSSREYDETVGDMDEDERKEYEDKYVSYANGAIYLEKETVCAAGSDEVSESFQEDFDNLVSLLKTRYEALRVSDMTLEIRDGYTVQVTLPQYMDEAAVAFQYLAYTGEFSVSFGSDETSAEQIIPSQKGKIRPTDYYVESASVRTQSDTVYLLIKFTEEGQEAIADATVDGSGYLYFYVGDNLILSLTVSETIDQETLYISGTYTEKSAAIVAALIDSAISYGDSDDMTLELGNISFQHAQAGENALLYVYIAVGALSLIMLVYFFLRYRRLAFAHLYSYLTFVIVMTLCYWAVSAFYVGVGTIIAFAVTALLLCVSNAVSFEYARKEYATGKTMTFSVKSGYRKCTWSLFDLHLALVILGLLVYWIALTELSVFGLALAFGAFFSGVCSLLFNRFLWHIMMVFAKDQGKFCHFKRDTGVDDDE